MYKIVTDMSFERSDIEFIHTILGFHSYEEARDYLRYEYWENTAPGFKYKNPRIRRDLD